MDARLQIADTGALAATTVLARLRSRIAATIAAEGDPSDHLDDAVAALADILATTLIAGWSLGADRCGRRIPREISALIGPETLRFGVEFPATDEALADLLSKRIVTRRDFDVMSDAARRKAFTVANQSAIDAIREVRDALAETMRTGPSHRKAKREIEARLGAGALGDAHLENVFRTNTLGQFAVGQEHVARDPIFREVFPYARYVAIHDDRTRDRHRELENWGLSGTNIYRADDPFWLHFTPPWEWNCRCSKYYMTIQQAARAGVWEAKVWLKSGVPPVAPEHRFSRVPVAPNPDFTPPLAA